MIDLFVDADLQKKLVSLYPIDYTFSEFEFAQYPQMKPATGENDTGVIVTYNTQAKKYFRQKHCCSSGSCRN